MSEEAGRPATVDGAAGAVGRRSRARVALLGAGAVLGAALVLGLVLRTRPGNGSQLSAADVKKTAATVVADALKKHDAQPAQSAKVYKTIAPSIVFISVKGKPASAVEVAGEEPDGGEGIGSGVIINDKGLIATAQHVIAGAREIEVTFADGTTSKAEVVDEQPERDLATLQAAQGPEVLVPATLGGGVNIGDETYAVGHPLGLYGSMSAGIVSGLNRSIPVDGDRTLDGLIQFDAAVNPGNSGGPLLDRNGRVVGIVTALANPSKQGFFVGIGFAVPIGAGGAGGQQGDGPGAPPI